MVRGVTFKISPPILFVTIKAGYSRTVYYRQKLTFTITN